MKMRKLLALLLALVMSLSLVACGGSDDEAAADDGASEEVTETLDTLVVYSSGAFQGAWDPTKNSILSNKHLEYQVYDCLLNYDAEANLTPNIATSWEYLEDGYTLRIYLNQGVKFHDGSELTAQDVIDTMDEDQKKVMYALVGVALEEAAAKETDKKDDDEGEEK